MKIHFPATRVNGEVIIWKSFQLAGRWSTFRGQRHDHCRLIAAIAEGADWSGSEATDLVLTPAACYPLYPTVAAKGAVLVELSDLKSRFRHEFQLNRPACSSSVCVRPPVSHTAEQVTGVSASAGWRKRPCSARLLDLPCVLDVANDLFFGRGGMLITNARATSS